MRKYDDVILGQDLNTDTPVITLSEFAFHKKSDGLKRAVGTYPPPPMPATALAAMSASIEGATPQSRVPEPSSRYRSVSRDNCYEGEVGWLTKQGKGK